VALVRVPFYFINLLPTSFLNTYILLACAYNCKGALAQAITQLL
jgi:hypothetical protein